MSEFGRTFLYVGGGAWILILAVMLFPVRRFHRFTMEKLVLAPPSRVWSVYDIDLANPESRALYAHVVSIDREEGERPVFKTVCDLSGGRRTRLITIRYEETAKRPHEILHTRVLDANDRPFPFGERHLSTFELKPKDGGTQVTFTWNGEIATLGQRFMLWRQYRRVMHQLKSICEGRPAAPMVRPRNPRIALAVSVLAILSFGFIFGWIVGLVLTLALVIHEFGHWLAMRLTGQPAPRVLLLPFLGGVTIANHPHKTLFNDAFCALMGAGFSALPVLALLILLLRLDWTIMLLGLDAAAFQPMGTVGLLARGALVISVINLFQLLPFLPLDGGQVLRALMQSFSVRWAKHILLGIGGAGMAAFIYLGDPLVAGIVGIGMLQSWHLSGTQTAARPMSGVGVTAISCAFLLTAAIHGAGAFYGLSILRQLQS
jgi:Zn-dependent protease